MSHQKGRKDVQRTKEMKYLTTQKVSRIPFHSAYKAPAHPLASFSLKPWMVGDYHSYHKTVLICQQPAIQRITLRPAQKMYQGK
jgi:hypothetical protein